ncbi:DUF2142 domain-containing protein [Acidisoma sp. 7E03]
MSTPQLLEKWQAERRPSVAPPMRLRSPAARDAGALKAARRLSLLIFLCLVLPLGLILAITTPAGGVADEAAHTLRAESLAHGEILGYRDIVPLADGSLRTAAGVTADPGLLGAMAVTGPGQWVTPQRLAAARHAEWAGMRRFVEITPLALYMPVFYLPSALAMRIVEQAHGGPAAAMLGGRLVNLFVYALLGFAALRTARNGHGLLLCALALPMEVSLAASLNQDGLLIATAVLAMALLTRADGAAPWRGAGAPPLPQAWLVATLLLGLIALVKLPYAGLLALTVLPLEARRACALRAGVAGLAALPALLWTGYAMGHISVPWPPLPPYVAGPLWPGPGHPLFTAPDARAQLTVLFAAPSRILTLTLHSILHIAPALAMQTIGVLGFLSLRLPLWLYALWVTTLVAAATTDRLHEAPPPARFRTRDAVFLIFALAGSVIAIYMSQYLTWTPVGGAWVVGPCGRYALPLLPALILFCPGGFVTRHAALLRHGGFLLIACAALCSLAVVPFCVLDGFYAP